LGVFDFILLFISLIAGIASGFIRFIIALVIALFTLSLVNEPLLPAWVEKIKFFFLDLVNRSYLSLIYLHHLHNNPILLTFVDFIKLKKSKDGKENVEKASKKLLIVRNKFYLAYFLTSNPKFGFDKLRKKKEQKELGGLQEEEENKTEEEEKTKEGKKKTDDTVQYIEESRDAIRGTKDPSFILENWELAESELPIEIGRSESPMDKNKI